MVTYLPFVASLAVATLSRFAAPHIWPRAAAWATLTAAVALAATTSGTLVLLACPLPARVPLIATLGQWRPDMVATRSPTPTVVSIIALALLAVLSLRIAREVRDLAYEIRDATRLQALVGARGTDVVVIDDPVPGAYAIGGNVTGRGSVVMTASMLSLLDDAERTAVIAHERSHVRCRHSLFLAAVRLSVALNPLLVGLNANMRFLLERWADEDAAVNNDRPALASALAKVALAVLRVGDTAQIKSGFALGRHGVSERVAALLVEPNQRSRPAWVLVAAAAVAALAFAWSTRSTERFFEAARLLSRQ